MEDRRKSWKAAAFPQCHSYPQLLVLLFDAVAAPLCVEASSRKEVLQAAGGQVGDLNFWVSVMLCALCGRDIYMSAAMKLDMYWKIRANCAEVN